MLGRRSTTTLPVAFNSARKAVSWSLHSVAFTRTVGCDISRTDLATANRKFIRTGGSTSNLDKRMLPIHQCITNSHQAHFTTVTLRVIKPTTVIRLNGINLSLFIEVTMVRASTPILDRQPTPTPARSLEVRLEGTKEHKSEQLSERQYDRKQRINSSMNLAPFGVCGQGIA